MMNVVMLSGVMRSVILLTVIMVTVVMLSMVMVNVFMLSVVMVSVISVCGYIECRYTECHYGDRHYAECRRIVSLHNKLDLILKTYLHYLGNLSSQTPSLTCERGGLRQVRLFKTHILRIILRGF
jgi:hypothetical protein